MAIPTLPRPLSWRQRLALMDGSWIAFVIPLCCGLVFTVVFAYGADFSTRHFRDDDPVVSAHLVNLDITNRRRGPDLYEFRYRYVVDGVAYENVAIAKGLAELPNVARPLRVQYVPGHPYWSRIPGLKKTLLPNWAWLGGLFLMLIGVVVAVFCLRTARVRWRQVRYGIVTKASSTRRPLPGLDRRGRPMSEVILAFQANDGQHYELNLGPVGNFRHGESTRVVYLADSPSTVQRYDSLTKQVKALLSAPAA